MYDITKGYSYDKTYCINISEAVSFILYWEIIIMEKAKVKCIVEVYIRALYK